MWHRVPNEHTGWIVSFNLYQSFFKSCKSVHARKLQKQKKKKIESKQESCLKRTQGSKVSPNSRLQDHRSEKNIVKAENSRAQLWQERNCRHRQPYNIKRRWEKNHAIYQNKVRTENGEGELGQPVQMNIYQSNTYRKNLYWLHF